MAETGSTGQNSMRKLTWLFPEAGALVALLLLVPYTVRRLKERRVEARMNRLELDN